MGNSASVGRGTVTREIGMMSFLVILILAGEGVLAVGEIHAVTGIESAYGDNPFCGASDFTYGVLRISVGPAVLAVG